MLLLCLATFSVGDNKGLVISDVEVGGGNVGHVKFCMCPPLPIRVCKQQVTPSLSINYFNDEPPLPLTRMYWQDVYKASTSWKLAITFND